MPQYTQPESSTARRKVPIATGACTIQTLTTNVCCSARCLRVQVRSRISRARAMQRSARGRPGAQKMQTRGRKAKFRMHENHEMATKGTMTTSNRQK
eukprot:4712067-Pleurochrysis_carterae.AAC.3